MKKRLFRLPRGLPISLLTVTALLGMMAFSELSMGFQNKKPNSTEIEVLPVQGNIYMLSGRDGSANTTVQVGKDGALVVDTGLPVQGKEILAAIRRLSDKPIREVISTSADADHVGGNEVLSNAGARLGFVQQVGDFATSGALVRAHTKVLDRMSAPTGKVSPFPFGSWPTDAFNSEKKDLYFNGESIRLLHQPAAHTDGDIIVYFRRSDVISAGDVLSTITYPVIDLQKGGSIKGMIDALNYIIDITIPEDKEEGGTIVIPGHGHLCVEPDVVDYRDMVTIIRDRIQHMIAKGMTLDQIKAARPTSDYDGLYGANTGSWTTAKFVEAVYEGLKK